MQKIIDIFDYQNPYVRTVCVDPDLDEDTPRGGAPPRAFRKRG